jgi:hypothetical protein
VKSPVNGEAPYARLLAPGLWQARQVVAQVARCSEERRATVLITAIARDRTGGGKRLLQQGAVFIVERKRKDARIVGAMLRLAKARAAALQVVLIGVLIALMLLWRPRGLLGEATAVSRHAASPGGPSR